MRDRFDTASVVDTSASSLTMFRVAHGRSTWWRRTIAVVGLVGIGSGLWWVRPHEWIRPLEYDTTTPTEVGEIGVSIRTESFSITDGDNGPARVTLSTDTETVVVDSTFNNDLFSDVRPGYLSRRDVDGDGRRDLVLWIPGINGLESTTYVSGANGAVTKLDVALERPPAW
jgi:hypothetical protein